jgi:tetratricopeptide (TPR) repeat protein
MPDDFVPSEDTPEDAAFLVDGMPKDHLTDDGLTLGELLAADEPEELEGDTREFAREPTETLRPTERIDMGALHPTEWTVDEEAAPGLLRRMIGWVFPLENADTRLTHLSQAITTYPDAPTNYLLRGELYLQHHEYAQAIADFHRAVELASAQMETDRWGLMAQAVQDRALAGLRKAQKKISNRKERGASLRDA